MVPCAHVYIVGFGSQVRTPKLCPALANIELFIWIALLLIMCKPVMVICCDGWFTMLLSYHFPRSAPVTVRGTRRKYWHSAFHGKIFLYQIKPIRTTGSLLAAATSRTILIDGTIIDGTMLDIDRKLPFSIFSDSADKPSWGIAKATTYSGWQSLTSKPLSQL